jgi:hypothetical protein
VVSALDRQRQHWFRQPGSDPVNAGIDHHVFEVRSERPDEHVQKRGVEVIAGVGVERQHTCMWDVRVERLQLTRDRIPHARSASHRVRDRAQVPARIQPQARCQRAGYQIEVDDHGLRHQAEQGTETGGHCRATRRAMAARDREYTRAIGGGIGNRCRTRGRMAFVGPARSGA